ncbi:recombinase RecT [Solibaculum intestinale]|uniref:Recombinase RecT n=1 Tax=Solibaculum intestinale TaxID=3133165 RepID=A0ABV1E2P3_9FIRM
MGKIQNALQANRTAELQTGDPASKSVTAILNSMLDSEGYRKRFDELLGRRAPQFVSSIITLVNADKNLQKAFYEAPVTVIQSALKAATFDLPIDPNLGYAYIVPFNNSAKQPDGSWSKRMEAAFILGYKGMNQLALRTGAYKTINVIDVRKGELKSYNRLTEEIDLDFIEDEDERESLPIIGWVGYFKLVNGTEKTLYMTKKQIEAHERKHRKGKNMGRGWVENPDAMAEKTVFRRLIGKWGLMSIDYQKADATTLAAADAIAKGQFDDEDALPEIIVDGDTGEIVEPGVENQTKLV